MLAVVLESPLALSLPNILLLRESILISLMLYNTLRPTLALNTLGETCLKVFLKEMPFS
ncbi:hypothetical protein PTKIN_Ptkin11bG0093900 [Pterospermum kingtungense]